MQEGDLVLTPLPQADGQIKIRPALVLREVPPFSDMLVCGISTQLRQQVTDFDEVISPADLDFPASGLRATSLIRLGFLIVFPQKVIIGVIGSVSRTRHERLLRRLSQYLIQNTT